MKRKGKFNYKVLKNDEVLFEASTGIDVADFLCVTPHAIYHALRRHAKIGREFTIIRTEKPQ